MRIQSGQIKCVIDETRIRPWLDNRPPMPDVWIRADDISRTYRSLQVPVMVNVPVERPIRLKLSIHSKIEDGCIYYRYEYGSEDGAVTVIGSWYDSGRLAELADYARGSWVAYD